MEKEKKGRAIALLPIGVFLIIFLGAGIVFKDFYAMPAIVAFLIALFVAFLQNKELSFNKKIEVIAKGVGEENIITMSLIFLCAGGFSGAVTAAGGVDSTVNLGLSLIPAHFAVAGLFLIGCFISVSMGTSMGTIAALAPIAVGISEKTGFALSICIGAVVCGAMFGDNLSMISDTTIAAVKTQGCEMKDKFRENFWIAFPAAVVTLAVILILSFQTEIKGHVTQSYHLLQVLPYVLVLIGGIIGINVFVVLLTGIVSGAVIMLAGGHITPVELLTNMGSGVSGMFETCMVAILVAAMCALIREYGGFDALLGWIHKIFRGKKGGQLGMGLLVGAMDIATANNTVAIVMANPIAKEMAQEYDITPRKTASILDTFSCIFQGVIPYGAQMLVAISAAHELGYEISAFQIMPRLFYPMFLLLCSLIAIFGVEKKQR